MEDARAGNRARVEAGMSPRDHLDSLDDEIRDHLERDTQEHIERGMTPEAARDAARRKFGNVTLVKEDARAVTIPVWLDQWSPRPRYPPRVCRRDPRLPPAAGPPL